MLNIISWARLLWFSREHATEKPFPFVSWSPQASKPIKKKLALLCFTHEHIFIAWCLFKHLWNYSAECLGCKKGEKQQQQEGKHWNVYINKHYIPKKWLSGEKRFSFEKQREIFQRKTTRKFIFMLETIFLFIGLSFIASCALVSRKLFCLSLSENVHL